MALRKGHGTGAGKPRIETLPVDELPAGVPENARTVSRSDRRERGLFAPGNAFARAGGKARAGKTRLADRLGLHPLPEGSTFAPYKAGAVSFRRAQCAALAAMVGGGYCGPGPSACVASAALQLAWSRWFSDRAAETGNGDFALQASKLANDSRQNLLAAHELCAREAEARKAARKNMPKSLVAALDDGEGGA
jgi:hypothetical protein